jgi:hypothetical protein
MPEQPKPARLEVVAANLLDVSLNADGSTTSRIEATMADGTRVMLCIAGTWAIAEGATDG